jgi:chloramphenicol-sensitive protein RarD
MNHELGKGIFFAVLAYFLWGILPLYWKLLSAIDPLHILALRIILSLVLVGVVLALNKNFAWLAVFKNRKKAGFMVLAGILLCAHWGIYIWAVNRGHTIESSLGYYINPLISIILGMIFFREKLKALQWAAFGLAALGVLILTMLSGTMPWIALSLALTFGFYGLLKKKIHLSALESLGAETLASIPVGLFLIFFRFEWNGAPRLLPAPLNYLGTLPVHVWILLVFCGLVTSFPLYCFARGTKILPLSTMGFAQFLSPTMQFLLGLLVFHENFPARYFASFGIIWFAVILYIISLTQLDKKNEHTK